SQPLHGDPVSFADCPAGRPARMPSRDGMDRRAAQPHHGARAHRASDLRRPVSSRIDPDRSGQADVGQFSQSRGGFELIPCPLSHSSRPSDPANGSKISFFSVGSIFPTRMEPSLWRSIPNRYREPLRGLSSFVDWPERFTWSTIWWTRPATGFTRKSAIVRL